MGLKGQEIYFSYWIIIGVFLIVTIIFTIEGLYEGDTRGRVRESNNFYLARVLILDSTTFISTISYLTLTTEKSLENSYFESSKVRLLFPRFSDVCWRQCNLCL